LLLGFKVHSSIVSCLFGYQIAVGSYERNCKIRALNHNRSGVVVTHDLLRLTNAHEG